MSMSDRELKILEDLEYEFLPPTASAVRSRWTGISLATRLVAASIAAAVGLSLLTVGVTLGNAAGIVLSVVAYVLVVGAVWTFVDGTADRRARKRSARAERNARRPRYLW